MVTFVADKYFITICNQQHIIVFFYNILNTVNFNHTLYICNA